MKDKDYKYILGILLLIIILFVTKGCTVNPIADNSTSSQISEISNMTSLYSSITSSTIIQSSTSISSSSSNTSSPSSLSSSTSSSSSPSGPIETIYYAKLDFNLSFTEEQVANEFNKVGIYTSTIMHFYDENKSVYKSLSLTMLFLDDKYIFNTLKIKLSCNNERNTLITLHGTDFLEDGNSIVYNPGKISFIDTTFRTKGMLKDKIYVFGIDNGLGFDLLQMEFSYEE